MSMARLLKKDNRNLNVMYLLKHSVINFILVCNAQSRYVLLLKIIRVLPNNFNKSTSTTPFGMKSLSNNPILKGILFR